MDFRQLYLRVAAPFAKKLFKPIIDTKFWNATIYYSESLKYTLPQSPPIGLYMSQPATENLKLLCNYINDMQYPLSFVQLLSVLH